MQKTIRLWLLEAIRDHMADMEAELPVGDPYGYAPTICELGPLGDFDKRKRFSIGITTGREIKAHRYPLMENTFTLNVEWQYQVQTEEGKPAIVAEHVLGAIQRRLMEIGLNNRPAPFDTLVVDFREVGNDVELDTATDKFIEGVLFWDVVYRHDHDDPRTMLK